MKSTSIESPGSRVEVFAQIKSLLAKREENRLVEDVQDLLDNRIKSLSPNSVTIWLPNCSVSKNEALRIMLDKTLRTCKAVLSQGTIQPFNILFFLDHDPLENTQVNYGLDDEIRVQSIASNAFEDNFFKVVRKTIMETKDFEIDMIPSLSYYIGTLLGSKNALMLLASNGFVEVSPS